MNILKEKTKESRVVMNMNRNEEKLVEAKALIHIWIHGKNNWKRKQSIVRAVYLLKKSAYAGYVEAQFELGQLYEDTGYLGHKPRWSNYWYRKAGNQGHGEACNCLGYNYEHGIGLKIDKKKAKNWYKKGAKLGSVLAAGNLE